jgi:hypothetical protein
MRGNYCMEQMALVVEQQVRHSLGIPLVPLLW